MKKSVFFVVLVTATVLTLPACGKNRKDPQPPEQKITAPVEILYEMPAQSAKGMVTNLKITAYPTTDADSVSLSIDLPAGVELVSGQRQMQGGALKSRQKMEGGMKLRCNADGKFTIPVTAFVDFNGLKQSKTIGIEWTVGKGGNQQSSGTLSKDQKYREISGH